MDAKLPHYVVPDLTGFKLKPYVAHTVSSKATANDNSKSETSETAKLQ